MTALNALNIVNQRTSLPTPAKLTHHQLYSSMQPFSSRPLQFLLFLLLTLSTSATQISELVRNPSFFGAYTFRTFRDGTLLASAFSGLQTIKKLKLNPIVSVPSPPSDDKLSSTIVLARVHPNSTVIWATAITTMSINVGIAIDNRNNVYAAASPNFRLGHPEGTVHIIKHDPNGNRLYEIFHTPPPRDPEDDSSDPLYDIGASEFPREAGLAFVHPSTLVIGAQLFKGRSTVYGQPALLTFNAKNGVFLNVQGAKSPQNISAGTFFSTTNVPVSRTKRGPLACYMFKGSKSVFKGEPHLFARCTLLTRTGAPVTREIDTGLTDDAFFYLAAATLEERTTSSRLPSFFVAYERGNSNQNNNQLVLRRLDAETLEDVDWATGRKSKSARPIIVNLPEPNPNGNIHTTFHYTIKYSRKTRSVTLFLASSNRISKFIPDQSGRGDITAAADPTEQFTRQYWMFTFDEKRQLIPQSLDVFDGFSPDVFDFSRNNKCLYLFGYVEGPHWMFQPISNAYTCRKSRGCCKA